MFDGFSVRYNPLEAECVRFPVTQRPERPGNLDHPIRFAISLRIFSGDIPPHEVSARLGLDATSAVGRDPMPDPQRALNFRMGEKNGWFLESEAGVDSRDPREHIDWFHEQIAILQPGLAVLMKEEGVRAEVSIIIWSDSGGAHLHLAPPDINGFFALGLPVAISFADYPDRRPNVDF